MSSIKDRLKYLFTTTNGLVLMAIAIVAVVTAIWGTLSGPMAEIGVRDVTIEALGMDMVEAQREGRLIMLYHGIAMAVVAVLVYFTTAVYRMDRNLARLANVAVTLGYLTALPTALLFAYFGHNWVAHGVYLIGLNMVFFSGLVLIVALWPWNKKYYLGSESPYGHLKSGFDLERFALWLTITCAVFAAGVGAFAGAYFGKGFRAFLTEDTIRYVYKTVQMKAVIGHLHIMLALMCILGLLIIARWLDFKGILQKIGMPLVALGSLFLTAGSTSVIWTIHAHTIVYVGAVTGMSGGLFLVLYGLPKIMRDRIEEQGLTGKATFGQKVMALFHDPLRFGVQWMMIFMNFTVSFVGIFYAIKLTDIIRVWPHRDERIELAGHWHILSAILAIILLFYFADRVGLKGKMRQWFGWIIIISSNVAFGSVTVFFLKRLWVVEYMQQPLVNTTMILADIGLGLILILLAAFLVWRLIDLIKPDGSWKAELEGDMEDSGWGKTYIIEPAYVTQEKKDAGQGVSQ